MALAIDTPRALVLGEQNDIPVDVGEKIYQGSAVGIVVGTGFARALAAGDKFAGFAEVGADNTLGLAAAIIVKVLKRGTARLAVTSLAVTNIGAVVYASDDNTFTLDSATGTNSVIGTVVRFVSTGIGDVEFENYRLATS